MTGRGVAKASIANIARVLRDLGNDTIPLGSSMAIWPSKRSLRMGISPLRKAPPPFSSALTRRKLPIQPAPRHLLPPATAQ